MLISSLDAADQRNAPAEATDEEHEYGDDEYESEDDVLIRDFVFCVSSDDDYDDHEFVNDGDGDDVKPDHAVVIQEVADQAVMAEPANPPRTSGQVMELNLLESCMAMKFAVDRLNLARLQARTVPPSDPERFFYTRPPDRLPPPSYLLRQYCPPLPRGGASAADASPDAEDRNLYPDVTIRNPPVTNEGKSLLKI